MRTILLEVEFDISRNRVKFDMGGSIDVSTIVAMDSMAHNTTCATDMQFVGFGRFHVYVAYHYA